MIYSVEIYMIYVKSDRYGPLSQSFSAPRSKSLQMFTIIKKHARRTVGPVVAWLPEAAGLGPELRMASRWNLNPLQAIQSFWFSI